MAHHHDTPFLGSSPVIGRRVPLAGFLSNRVQVGSNFHNFPIFTFLNTVPHDGLTD